MIETLVELDDKFFRRQVKDKHGNIKYRNGDGVRLVEAVKKMGLENPESQDYLNCKTILDSLITLYCYRNYFGSTKKTNKARSKGITYERDGRNYFYSTMDENHVTLRLKGVSDNGLERAVKNYFIKNSDKTDSLLVARSVVNELIKKLNKYSKYENAYFSEIERVKSKNPDSLMNRLKSIKKSLDEDIKYQKKKYSNTGKTVALTSLITLIMVSALYYGKDKIGSSINTGKTETEVTDENLYTESSVEPESSFIESQFDSDNPEVETEFNTQESLTESETTAKVEGKTEPESNIEPEWSERW